MIAMYEVFFFVYRRDGKKVFIENVPVNNISLIKELFNTYIESKRKGLIRSYSATMVYCPVEPLFLF